MIACCSTSNFFNAIFVVLYLQVVLEFDRNAEGEIGNLGRKILQKKFESYNKAWIGAMAEEFDAGNMNMMQQMHMHGGEGYHHNQVRA
jgi:hypothetical protein